MISVLCVTNNEHPQVGAFIRHLRDVAEALGAELVLGLDRPAAQSAEWRDVADVTLDLEADKLQEDVLDQAVDACSGEWVLRLDDDERVSPALLEWLKGEGYIKARSDLYAFPRVYNYPDAQHILANDGIWPDLQTRLGKRELMKGYNAVHAGNPRGTGRVVPYALEHHKLLVRSLEDRKAIAKRYEECRKGAGSDPLYARYNLPELVYAELVIKEYRDGDFTAR